MSANHRHRDGYIYFPHKLDLFMDGVISSQFDMQCDLDEQEIIDIVREKKYLKKVCLYKVLLFIPEYFLSRVLFDSEAAKFKKKAMKLYWKYYKNKISVETFKKELISIMENGKII